MRIRSKRLLAVLLAALFLLSSAVPVCAAGDTVVDWTKTGKVSVTLKVSDGEAVSGAEITLYLVADAKSEKSNLIYSYTESFKGCGIPESDLYQAESASKLEKYAAENSIAGTVTKETGPDGSVRFEGLALGLYLVVQTGSVEGFSDCTPFFAALPYCDEQGWYYEVDATPKTDVIRIQNLTVYKVWKGGGKKHPDSVTIQLLRGGAVEDTVILNEANNWKYTWTGLPKGEDWSVEEIDVPKDYKVTYKQEGIEYTVTNTKKISPSSGGSSDDPAPTITETVTETVKLAQTGQLNWPVPLLACAGMLLFAAGWALVFMKKEKDHA